MSDQNDILLINRDKYFLAQIVKTLQEEGFTVHTAMEMRGALATLAGNPVGLIICDKALEDIDGIEFLSFIKKDPLRENIPFMFYVSLSDQAYPLRAFQLGAVDYVVYPIDTQALVDRINNAFSMGAPNPASVPVKAPAARPAAPPKPTPVKKAPTSEIEALFDTPLNVEVSRDGVIWLPSIVTQFRHKGLTMETSMIGKTGVTLMIRVKAPDGAFILNGIVKDISFNDFQKPAGLEIDIKDNENWQRIQAGAKIEDEPSGISQEISAAEEKSHELSQHLTNSSASGPQIVRSQTQENAAKRESSYDKRFYQSLIGKQLDNYRAISVIGIGNMGGVLQGWDVALEREVALKIISYKLSSKANFRDLFIKEARVISKLNHPNIAQIYNIGSSNEILYYAMELIDGITLKDIIRDEKQLDISRGLEYLQTVCGALEIVYQNSIVHRDIKPANLMISKAGIVKIVDFGVAKTHDARSGSGGKKGLFGTPMYMSPEQIAGLAIDHRSDMYSLGATFYHAFCGVPPFRADNVKGLLNHHLRTPLTPLTEKNPKIPAQLSQVIERMMAKDPFERYKSFSAIAEEIKHLGV